MKKKRGLKAIVLSMTIILAATLAGCGNSGKSSNNYTSYDSNTLAPDMSNDMVSLESYSMENSIQEEAKESGEVQNSQSNVTVSDRKLIRTVNMSVETKEFDSVMESLDNQIKASGGYVENMETYNGSVYSGYRNSRSANMKIRIPKDKVDDFLNTVSGITNVISKSESVEDVTLVYVDLESHKKALETEQTRLLELLQKAESIEDIITIEQRLSHVRYQIESMESQLRTYDNKVDYSTVYLDISEVQELTPIVEETVWERISLGFLESVTSIVDGVKELAIWFIINIPYLIIWAAVITVIILVARRSMKKKDKNKDKKKPGIEQMGKDKKNE